MIETDAVAPPPGFRRLPFYLMVYDLMNRSFTRVPGLQFKTRAEAETFVKEHSERFSTGRFRFPYVRRDH